jgi:hypothetical protein
METGTERGEPESGGTVTRHMVCDGQDVAAAWPPKRATISPSALRKSVPDTVTCWPDPPVDGLSDERSGAVPVAAVLGTEALDRVDLGRARAGPLGPFLGEVV